MRQYIQTQPDGLGGKRGVNEMVESVIEEKQVKSALIELKSSWKRTRHTHMQWWIRGCPWQTGRGDPKGLMRAH